MRILKSIAVLLVSFLIWILLSFQTDYFGLIQIMRREYSFEDIFYKITIQLIPYILSVFCCSGYIIISNYTNKQSSVLRKKLQKKGIFIFSFLLWFSLAIGIQIPFAITHRWFPGIQTLLYIIPLALSVLSTTIILKFTKDYKYISLEKRMVGGLPERYKYLRIYQYFLWSIFVFCFYGLLTNFTMISSLDKGFLSLGISIGLITSLFVSYSLIKNNELLVLKTAKQKKSEPMDVEKELEKYKGMVDKGLISEEDYEAKKKELLGL